MVSATAKISAIKNKHLYFTNVEQKVYLQSIGRTLDAYLASSRSESECSEDEKDTEMIPGEVNNKRPLDIAQAFPRLSGDWGTREHARSAREG